MWRHRKAGKCCSTFRQTPAEASHGGGPRCPRAKCCTPSHHLEYPYSRSVGPVIGAFLTGLRDGTVLGVRGAGGAVIVPPTEYDPITGEDTGELVEVGPGGVVETWAWVSHPLRQAPAVRPFAWALIRLDGADTAMLHVVDAGGPDALATR